MDIRLPNLGEGADSGVVVNLLVKIGDNVTEGQNLIELETGKAVAGIPSTAAGKVATLGVKVGDKIGPGAILVTLEGGPSQTSGPAKLAAVPPKSAPPAAEPAASELQTEEEPLPSLESTEQYAMPPAAPSIRRLARDLGLDLRRVKGSQHGGRIVMDDLRKYIQRLIAQADKARLPATAASAPSATPVSIDFAQWGAVSRKPMSPLRQVIARRMVESTSTLPQVTQFDEADVTNLLALRKKLAPEYERKGGKLTLTGFVVQALVAALKAHPIFNSSLDEATQEIVFKSYCHLGIAVDTEAGLLVPVLRDADKKSLLEISQALESIAAQARERKLAPADMQGGSCTISNQGAIGGSHFTPIVNKPEAAILGVGKGALKPVALANGSLATRTLLPLSVSYDHRLIDGAQAARFITDLRQFLEKYPEDFAKL